MAWTRKLEEIEQKFLACEQAVQPSGPPSKKRTKKRKVDLQATREENPEMAELAALLQISHFQRVCQHINYKYLQQVNCHKMKVVLAIKKHFYSDKELDAEVEKIAIKFPYCGENFIKQILVQKGIKVQRMRIRESIGLTMMQSMPEKKEDYTDVIIT